jgi:hypothetical protein
MHSLQNYGEEEPSYDGNAYTFSSTYHAGQLKLYDHHVTAPTTPGGRLEYHMTQLDSYAMTGKREKFIEGATAFRNARDLAQRNRDRFIQTANARARQTDAEAPSEAEVTGALTEQYEDSTADEFVDCQDYVESQTVGTENYSASQDVGEGLALPEYLYEEEEEPSQQSTSLGAEPAMSFATSFASSFTGQSQTSSKRNRASNSPPSNSRPRKKHDPAKKHDSAKRHDSAKKRTRQSAPRRAAGSSAQGSISSGSAGPLEASAEEYWS